jgi:hypothetical protein
MNEIPRQKLCELVAHYGEAVSDDPRRCEALLRDLCGQYRREIFLLVTSLRDGVPQQLRASKGRVPAAVLVGHLSTRLSGSFGLEASAARWAVESWALALGVLSRSDLEAPKVRTAGVAPGRDQQPAAEVLGASRSGAAGLSSDDRGSSFAEREPTRAEAQAREAAEIRCRIEESVTALNSGDVARAFGHILPSGRYRRADGRLQTFAEMRRTLEKGARDGIRFHHAVCNLAVEVDDSLESAVCTARVVGFAQAPDGRTHAVDRRTREEWRKFNGGWVCVGGQVLT